MKRFTVYVGVMMSVFILSGLAKTIGIRLPDYP
jgi:hypothetical protein